MDLQISWKDMITWPWQDASWPSLAAAKPEAKAKAKAKAWAWGKPPASVVAAKAKPEA